MAPSRPYASTLASQGVLILCVAAALATAAGAVEPTHPQSAAPIVLDDVSHSSGIDFQHRDGSSGAHYLVEVMTGGMASFDYDRDGRTDLYFLNGGALKGVAYPTPPANGLFRNLGEFQFSECSQASGLDDHSFSMGVTIGDFNEDGFADVYVTNHGKNGLFQNNGDGTFSKVRDSATECGDKVGAGACMLDFDGDGDLDIYAASYMKFSYSIPASSFRDRVVYGGPLLYPKAPDNLLENNGAGGFNDISQASGISAETEWGMGTVCADFNGDGLSDIFVANDSTKNFLWINDGNGGFIDDALLNGVAYDFRGDPQGSMGVDIADVDGDQFFDLFQTAYTKQLATLYQSIDGAFFSDATLETGAGTGTFYPVNWGAGFGDFDNDGDSDIFIANGHIHDNLDDLDQTVVYKTRNMMMANMGSGKYSDVTDQAGSGLEITESSRGCIVDDLDDDGMLDVVILNSRVSPSVLKNGTRSDGKWLRLELIGAGSNRSAVGTVVTAHTTTGRQIRGVHSGRGYQSHFGMELHFGLPPGSEIQRLEIRWYSGQIQVVDAVKLNSRYIIVENRDPVLLPGTQGKSTIED